MTHTNALNNDLADAMHDTHSTFIAIDATVKVDGEPTQYAVTFTHWYKVDATTAVDALAAAMTGLRAAMGSA